MAILNFSKLLVNAMKERGLNQLELDALLKEKGILTVTNKKISAYITGRYTPNFEKAKALCDVLDIPIKTDELIESLRLNRILIREEKDKLLEANVDYKKFVVVNVRFKNLSENSDPVETEKKLLARIEELYGNKNVAEYVEKLIAADLKKSLV